MSMRPIDLQIIVPKTTEIASLQGSENARQLLASQHSADSTKAMVQADTREVHSKKDVQAVAMRVNRDNEKNERERNGKRRRRGGTGANSPGGGTFGDADINNKNLEHINGSSHIDIKL